MIGLELTRTVRSWKTLGLEEWAFGHDQVTPEHLAERFEALEGARDDVQAKLDAHLPEVKQRSLAQADLIAGSSGGSTTRNARPYSSRIPAAEQFVL